MMQRLQRLTRGVFALQNVSAHHAALLQRAAFAAEQVTSSGRLGDTIITACTIGACRRSIWTRAPPAPKPGQGNQDVTPEERASIALYFDGTPPSSDILGPIVEREIPGKGRGLVAARALAAGDLVMAVRPLAVLHGPQDAMPSPEQLVSHLRATWPHLPPASRRAIAAMHGARTAAAAAAAPALAAAAAAAAGGGGGAVSGSGSSGSSSSASTAAAGAGGGGGTAAAAVEDVDLRSVVSYNAYGDEYEDLAAADLRRSGSGSSSSSSSGSGSSPGAASAVGGGEVRSHVGLWPHFARLNHSCAPNCVHYVVAGDTLMVRAVQAIPEGAELTVSYLGRDDLAPAQVRQAALGGRYGFACGCARCAAEARLPGELRALLLQLHERARGDLAPRFERLLAATSTDPEELLRAAGAGAEEEEDEVEEGAEGLGAGTGGVSAAAVAARSGGLTAAEAAKRALKKAQAAAQRPPEQWPALLAALEPRLEEAARQLHTALRELQEDDEAVDEKDTREAEAAGSGGSGVSEARPPMTGVQAAQAACYQLLELLHLHAELLAGATAGPGGATSPARAAAASSALQACWHVLDAISRGSEVQVFQACKLLNDALLAARGSARRPASSSSSSSSAPASSSSASSSASSAPEPVREAAALLGQSLLARYGRLRGPHLGRLTQAALRTSRDFF